MKNIKCLLGFHETHIRIDEEYRVEYYIEKCKICGKVIKRFYTMDGEEEKL